MHSKCDVTLEFWVLWLKKCIQKLATLFDSIPNFNELQSNFLVFYPSKIRSKINWISTFHGKKFLQNVFLQLNHFSWFCRNLISRFWGKITKINFAKISYAKMSSLKVIQSVAAIFLLSRTEKLAIQIFLYPLVIWIINDC